MKYYIAQNLSKILMCAIFVTAGILLPRHFYYTELWWLISKGILIVGGIKPLSDPIVEDLTEKLLNKLFPPETTTDRLPFAHVAQKQSYAVINGVETLITKETINTDRGKLSHKGKLSILKGDDGELRTVFENGNIIN